MGKVNYLIPEDIRRRTVDALGRYMSRLETEAAALARFPQAEELALERLKQAEDVGNLADFYAGLGGGQPCRE